MATSVASQIWAFFAGKGLSPAQIAGIMGNLQVESGFNTGAANANEGAIGLAQWEGGRRTALQQFAGAMGSTETDLNVQLNFLWHELTTTESGALQQLRQATTAGDAAAAFDQYYERSSGEARQQRVTNAGNIFSTFQSQGVNGLSALGGSASGGGATTMSTGETALNATKPDYQSVLGDVYNMFQAVPELKKLLDNAIATNEDPTHFYNVTFVNSAWYKQHSSTFRSALAQKYADPGTWAQKTKQFSDSVLTLSREMGINLGPGRLAAIVQEGLFTGQDGDQAWLRRKIALTGSLPGDASGASGEMAQTLQQLKAMYSSYGIGGVPDLNFERAAQQILSGQTTIDTYRQHALNAAKSMFPGLSAQLDQGLTVADVAAPYQQQMAQLLELDPNSISVTDPLIRRALQGSTGDAKGLPVVTPLWQFQDQLRSDPRWAATQNAKDTISTALVKIGKDFGFGGF